MSGLDRVLFQLKTRGPRTAQEVAQALALTSMGARRQLEQAEALGLTAHADQAEKVGRPTRRWQLTEAGHARFPDRHADLTLQLLDSVRQLYGEDGIVRLIALREREAEAAYTQQLGQGADLPERVRRLAAARSAEGYMADVAEDTDGALLLLENHCPICAAARQCQHFCRSELAVFQRVLGPGCRVERSEHLLAGARRCAYRVVPIAADPHKQTLPS